MVLSIQDFQMFKHYTLYLSRCMQKILFFQKEIKGWWCTWVHSKVTSVCILPFQTPPLQTLNNRGAHLIFFHFPVQKGILNRTGGLGTSRAFGPKCQKCWIIVISDLKVILAAGTHSTRSLFIQSSFGLSVEEKRNRSETSTKQCEPLIRRLLEVSLMRVNANKQNF